MGERGGFGGTYLWGNGEGFPTTVCGHGDDILGIFMRV